MSKTINDLPSIAEHYKQVWSSIRKKYPQARGEIKFAFQGEFVNIGASVLEILKNNHFVVMDGEQKSRALSQIKTQKDLSDVEVKKILGASELNPDCRIEIIWTDLDYDLIAELQKDPLVDQTLTPQTRASIRIVLGKIGNLTD